MLDRLRAKIDLNLIAYWRHPSATLRQEAAYEFRQDDLLSADGLSSPSRLSSMRRSLPWQLQTPTFFLLGSVSVHGVRAIDLPGESARYRSLSAFGWHEALSHGHSQPRLPQHPCECESGARLAYLCRLRPDADLHGSRALCWRQFRCRPQADGLRTRCHNDRSVSFPVPVGTLPQAQGSCQTAHGSGICAAIFLPLS